jgi:hypothetical protein
MGGMKLPRFPRWLRPRFSLRTLLVFVTVSAVFWWAYWGGWTRWRLNCEQEAFVASVKQLKANMPVAKLPQLIKKGGRSTSAGYGRANPPINPIHVIGYFWSNAVYCIYYVEADRGSVESPNQPYVLRIELYRVSRTPQFSPESYESRHGKLGLSDYFEILLNVFSDEREHYHEFECELIYADPPRPN